MFEISEKSSGLRKKCFLLGFVLLILASAVVRLPYLSHYPPQVHNDESATGIYVTDFLKFEKWALYGSTWGHPNLNFWLSSLPTKITGEVSVWTIRVVSGLEGVLSLILFGSAVALLLGRRTSLFFLLNAAPFHLHAHYSRTGFIYNHAILFIALATFAFAALQRRATVGRQLLLGVSLGLSMLVYPVTQVLPLALLGAAIVPHILATWNPLKVFAECRKRARYMVFVVLGFFIGCGAQVVHWLQQGYESRVRSQFFLLPDPRVHLERIIGKPSSDLEIWWFSIKQTARFFYQGDVSAQYGFFSAPLAPALGLLAIIGVLIMIARSLKGDLFSLWVLFVSLGTFFGSTLLVELNFSPHLIVFGLYLPLFCAIGLNCFWSLIRVKQALLIAPVMLAFGVWWANWNFKYYEMNVQRWKQYRVTFILNLPIDAKSVRSLITLSTLPEPIKESYYALVFPNALTHISGPTPDDGQAILDIGAQSGFPALAIVDPSRQSGVEEKLRTANRNPTVFNHPQGSVFWVP